MAHLEIGSINKIFGNTTAVMDFNLAVETGEFISFLGPSGCGKTTTLRMIAGFEFPSSGKILLNGQDLTFLPPHKRNMGMVFQSYALFPNMTATQNVGYGLKIAGQNKRAIEQSVKEMLALIQMQDFADRYPYQLSGGQQQRLALARALAIHPQVLLLDEPLSALDAKIRLELRQEIRHIQQQLGITTIYVTHDQEEALSLSDRIVVMNLGKIEQVGKPTDIYNYPASEFVARFVGHINLLPVEVVSPAEGIVRLGSQLVRATHNGHLNGHPVQLAVRPEELHLGEKENANNLNCTINAVTYLGSIVRIQVNVDGQLMSVDVFNERKTIIPMIGESFRINFPPEACWLMDRNH
jgi:putative spermidine/putrescine transport system ATP-binding protein